MVIGYAAAREMGVEPRVSEAMLIEVEKLNRISNEKLQPGDQERISELIRNEAEKFPDETIPKTLLEARYELAAGNYSQAVDALYDYCVNDPRAESGPTEEPEADSATA